MSECSLYGRAIKQTDQSGISLAERLYEPGLKTPTHNHDEALFTFVLGGEYVEMFSGKELRCRRANALFHPGGDEHAEHFGSKGGRLFVANLGSELTEKYRQANILPTTTIQSSGGELNELGARLYEEFEHPDKYSEAVIPSLLQQIVVIASRISQRKESAERPIWLSEAEGIIEESYATSISLEEIATKCGVHKVHLAQTFKRFNEQTVGAAIREKRLKKAREQLRFTRIPISEIAINCGFSDQSHLTRLFSSEFGTSPSRFRESV